MSISPVQFVGLSLPASEAEQPAAPPVARTAEAEVSSSPEQPSVAAQAAAPQLSTDLRIDDQRRIYYAIVNTRSGDEVMEIPPEEIRKLAEALEASQVAVSKGHSVDVKT